MKTEKINVQIGRKILHDQNEHSIEIGLQVFLDEDEEFESVYHSVRNSLEGQLDTWEFEVKSNDRPSVITIPEISVNQAPPLVTASKLKAKSAKTKNETQKVYQQKATQELEQTTPSGEYICPSCGEQMLPKKPHLYQLPGHRDC